MNIEENVDVETTLTEEAIAVGPSEGQDASTVLGKFKDVDALAKAYESLQAEFTRRSQRLRSLEREVENFKRAEPSGAEKLRKTAEARRQSARAFDDFVAEVGERPVGKPTQSEEGAEGRLEEKTEEKLLANEGLQTKGDTPVTGGVSSEELFNQASNDEAVRLRIVGEYLASLGKSGAPITTGKGGVFAAPPVKAKTVGQAGDMALLYFRKTAN